MILQSTYVVVDCPICGRPLEMSSQLTSREVACGHCQGKFSVYEADDGSLATSCRGEINSLERAELLLLATSDTDLSDSEPGDCQRGISLISGQDEKTCLEDSLRSLPKEAKSEQASQPTILLVEHRDEIFARIATDLAEFGMRVVRAKTATEALQLVETYKPVLLVGNVDLPGQSGWLLTAKLRLFDQRIRVWLYRHQASDYGHEIANLLDIDALLAHHGDLFGLSQTIVDRVADHSSDSRDSAND